MIYITTFLFEMHLNYMKNSRRLVCSEMADIKRVWNLWEKELLSSKQYEHEDEIRRYEEHVFVS